MATTLPLVNPRPAIGSAAQIAALTDAISTARLSMFLRRTHGNVRRALDLYAWNIRAGAALYPILHLNEVALPKRHQPRARLAVRSGVAVCAWVPPRPARAGASHLRQVHAEARGQPADIPGTHRRRRGRPDVLVLGVPLTSRFDQRTWSREFACSFPSAPPRIDREIVHARADTIRRLRNRIAHWEPLLDVDLVGAYQRAASMVRWISPATAAWTAERWPLPPDVLVRP